MDNLRDFANDHRVAVIFSAGFMVIGILGHDVSWGLVGIWLLVAVK